MMKNWYLSTIWRFQNNCHLTTMCLQKAYCPDEVLEETTLKEVAEVVEATDEAEKPIPEQ